MASQKRFNFGRAGTLFNRKTIKRELTKVVFEPSDQQLRAAKNWADQVRHPNFDKAKETAFRGEFIQTVLVTLLGYTPYRASETFTVATEEALGKGAVDTALAEIRLYAFGHGRELYETWDLGRLDDPAEHERTDCSKICPSTLTGTSFGHAPIFGREIIEGGDEERARATGWIDDG